ncbi:MAG: hypothetical protein ACIALR_05225, partial [Blastopirellula sp. JB062]
GMGMDGMDPEMMMAEMDNPYGDGMGGGAMVLFDPAQFRYVDKDYKKIDAETLKTAMTQPTAEDYYLAVAKRLPVRMRMTIDQRKIDKLLVECGNADLTLEVRQLRLNPTTGSGMGGGYGGGLGGGYQGGFESESYMGMGGSQQKVDNRYDVPIEIYGIIYIYNPVNKELLGITDGAESEEGLGAADDTAMRSGAIR